MAPRPSLVPALAAALILLSGCGGQKGDFYNLAWTFINTDNLQVDFSVEDEGDGHGADVQVSGGSQGSATTGGSFHDGIGDVRTIDVYVTARSSSLERRVTQTVSVQNRSTTNITVTWDGANVTVSSEISCAPQPVSAIAGPSVACQAPNAWVLTGVTGNSTGTWSDQSGSATGTLTVNFPQQVQENASYPVSVTFSGSFTAAAGFAGVRKNISTSMCDRSTLGTMCGLAATSSKLLEPANPTSSGSVTWSGTWAVPSLGSQTTFTVEAGGGFDLPGTPLRRTATYTKSP